MRLVFAGTPDAAVPSLRRILGSEHEVVAVVSRPDARSGRGRRVARSPVAVVADEAGVPVLQPTSLRDEEFLAELVRLAPDAAPVVAYGGLIPPAALEIPKRGWINLHFSLLPAWRGAAPVQHSIWAGDDITGASTFLLEEGLDTGPIFGTLVEVLDPKDTTGAVLERLAHSGADLLLATLDGLAAGELVPQPQPSEGVSLAPKISSEDARIDWSRPGLAIERQLRALAPAPMAWTTYRNERVRIYPGQLVSDADPLPPGHLRQATRNGWQVGTGSQALLLGDVQAAGKKKMTAADWLRGVNQPETEPMQ
ncbi:MAG: methionyl-tRNA formyltransferase [Micrococcales bacterium]|nr:methionyl-tRNA formyltransferase [Micrococcales bacterium]